MDVYRLIGGEFVHRVVTNDGQLRWERSIFAPSVRHAHFSWSQCIGSMLWYGGSQDDIADMCGLPPTHMGNKGKMGIALQRYRAALDLQKQATTYNHSDQIASVPLNGSVVPVPETDFPLEDGGVGALHSMGVGANHGVFSVLELLLSEGNAEAETDLSVAQCIEALRCEGFTRDALDHRGVFMVLSLLECIGFVDQSDERACVVRKHFLYHS